MHDILEILREEDRELLATIDAIEYFAEEKNPYYVTLFNEFKRKFLAHDEAEEAFLYPAVETYSDLDKLVSKCQESYHYIKAGLIELRSVPFESRRWIKKFSTICDAVLSHISLEEEMLFPELSKLFNVAVLKDLGKQLLAERNNQKLQVA